MTLKSIYAGALATVCAFAAGVASAATLSVTGGDAIALTSNFSLSGPAYNALSGGVGSVGSTIKVLTDATKTVANGLSLSGPARVTFTYLGSEAGYSNVLSYAGADVLGNKFSTVGDVSAAFDAQGGFMPFSFASLATSTAANDGFITSGVRIAFSEVFNGGLSVLAFFDDRTLDIDYDDLAVRIDIVPIPLPAAGWMLLLGFGGLGLLARGRRMA